MRRAKASDSVGESRESVRIMESSSESRNEDRRTADRSRRPAPCRASPLPLFTYAHDSGASEDTVPSKTNSFGLASMPSHEIILSPWLLYCLCAVTRILCYVALALPLGQPVSTRRASSVVWATENCSDCRSLLGRAKKPSRKWTMSASG